MRAPLPSGTDQAEIQQIVETVELGAIHNVFAKVISLQFATKKIDRHPAGFQSTA